MFRIGNSYDIHELKEGKGIKIGGVSIPCEFEVVAHSDGDVLIHAIIDAILGALALGDIGKFFPDTDSRYEGIDSMKLLKKVKEVYENYGRILNIDATIVLEKPKLRSYIDSMRIEIAETLEIATNQINVKATTNEKVGAVGNSEAIVAMASVLIRLNN